MSEFLGWIKMPYSKSLGFKDLSLPIFFFSNPSVLEEPLSWLHFIIPNSTNI